MREVYPDKPILNRRQQTTMRIEQQLTALRLQRYVCYSLLSLFVLNGICALLVIFLVGYGQMVLSERLIMTMLMETIAQAAALFVIVTKHLFPLA